MDEIEFKYVNEEIDAIGASACSECAALIYVWHEDRHREWHARTAVRIGTESGVYERGSTVERASRPKPWEA